MNLDSFLSEVLGSGTAYVFVVLLVSHIGLLLPVWDDSQASRRWGIANRYHNTIVLSLLLAWLYTDDPRLYIGQIN